MPLGTSLRMMLLMNLEFLYKITRNLPQLDFPHSSAKVFIAAIVCPFPSHQSAYFQSSETEVFRHKHPASTPGIPHFRSFHRKLQVCNSQGSHLLAPHLAASTAQRRCRPETRSARDWGEAAASVQATPPLQRRPSLALAKTRCWSYWVASLFVG